MPSSTQLLAFAAAAISTASAGSIQGMNVGSTDSSGAARDQANFQTYFSTSKNLEGTNNAFNSARLYTMIVSFGRAYGTQVGIKLIIR